MKLRVHEFADGSTFLESAGVYLLRNEARNNLILGLVERFGASGKRGVSRGFLVVGEDGPVACAVRAGERGLIVSDGPTEAADAFLEAVSDEGDRLPAVRGDEPSVSAFAERWCERYGGVATTRMRQRLHRIDAIDDLDRHLAIGGSLRVGVEADRELVERWTRGFCADIGSPPPSMADMVHLDSGRLHVWDDAGPRAMATWSRPTANGCSIGLVYTPDDERGKGYATALVAALTQKMLDAGRSFCTLFTDAANPTSNRIYARIGYVPIAEHRLVNLAV